MDFIIATFTMFGLALGAAYVVNKLIPNSFIDWVGEKFF